MCYLSQDGSLLGTSIFQFFLFFLQKCDLISILLLSPIITMVCSDLQNKIKTVHRHLLCTQLIENLEQLDRLVEMEDSLLVMKSKLETVPNLAELMMDMEGRNSMDAYAMTVLMAVLVLDTMKNCALMLVGLVLQPEITLVL